MVERADDVDDGSDDEVNRPPLPPEDRLWRHPSEMATYRSPQSPDLLAARRRWLAAAPSRAGAWSAGLVGALLAAGVVLLGTNLTSVLGPRDSGIRANLSDVTTTTLDAGFGAASGAQAAVAKKVAEHMAFVEGWQGRNEICSDGVVVASDGMIAVPDELVENAKMVQVTLSDGEQFGAVTVVGIDEATGLAVIHIDDAGLSPAVSSGAGHLRRGDWTAVEWATATHVVLAIGAVVTAREGVGWKGGPALLSSVTTDLRVPSSTPEGAALVDSAGGFVGLVTEHTGAAFVEIPAATVERISGQLIEHGRVVHGWLGVTGVSVARRPASGHGAALSGVRVTRVLRSSAAAKAGLRPGDVIEAVGGEPVVTMGELQARLYLMAPHRAVEIEVERKGHFFECMARLQPAA